MQVAKQIKFTYLLNKHKLTGLLKGQNQGLCNKGKQIQKMGKGKGKKNFLNMSKIH